MTRYREAFSWPHGIGAFLDEKCRERPLLHVCAGRSTWGDVRCDLWEPSSVRADWRTLPFAGDSFGAVFADPPWDASYKSDCAVFVREALRVAPVAYLMAPWVYGASWVRVTHAYWRQMPGVQTPVMLTRYERACARVPELSPRLEQPLSGRLFS